MASRKLIVFAKAPIAGRVKTRLIPTLGAQGACNLYQRLLEHSLDIALATGLPVEVWIKGADESRYFSNLRKKMPFQLFQQAGEDLGERMRHAFEHSLAHDRQCVMIGSDCPTLTTKVLQQAFVLLSNHQAVFAPSQDGGYALIGLDEPLEALFQNIEWGTDKVYATTERVLGEQNISYGKLAQQRDIDVADDLVFLQENYPQLMPS